MTLELKIWWKTQRNIIKFKTVLIDMDLRSKGEEDDK